MDGAVETVVAAVPQFGAAGLVAWMWLVERRASAARERELTEAHRRLMAEARDAGVLVQVVRENTAALARLETTQRALVDALSRGARVVDRADEGVGIDGVRRAG